MIFTNSKNRSLGPVQNTPLCHGCKDMALLALGIPIKVFLVAFPLKYSPLKIVLLGAVAVKEPPLKFNFQRRFLLVSLFSFWAQVFIFVCVLLPMFLRVTPLLVFPFLVPSMLPFCNFFFRLFSLLFFSSITRFFLVLFLFWDCFWCLQLWSFCFVLFWVRWVRGLWELWNGQWPTPI